MYLGTYSSPFDPKNSKELNGVDIRRFNPWHYNDRKSEHAPPCDMALGPGGGRKERKVPTGHRQ